jgi:polyisoprenoid-binding protein YceI
MRVRVRCKLLSAGALSLMMIVGCAVRPPAPVSPPAAAPPGLAPHVGTPYDIAPGESLLTVLVYRGGTLASVGHNHVIASHDLSGTVYVPADIFRGSFEVHVPIGTLRVDEESLRAGQHGGDFPPGVPESAKQGTRRNLLGPALLDAEHYPEIVLRAVRLERATGSDSGAAGATAGTLLARVQATVRGQPYEFAAAVRYRIGDGEAEIASEFPLRQSELGLTPFSAMLGALQVQDEMRVSLRILARTAPLRSK